MDDDQPNLWRELSSDEPSKQDEDDSSMICQGYGYRKINIGLDRSHMPIITNQDDFYSDLYEYYEKHGLLCILMEQAMDVFILAFTTLFSVFLFLFFDWSAIMECESAETCYDLKTYVNSQPNVHGFWGGMVLMYFTTLTLLWIWRFLSYSVRIPRLIKINQFVTKILQISDTDLPTIKWSEIVNRIRALHRRDSRIMRLTDQVTAHDIASRIMRRDNYLIAMIENKVLDVHFNQTGCCTSWLLRRCCSAPESTRICTNLLFTRHLEWNIRVCLLNHLHDENDRLAIDSSGKYRSWFRYMAVFNLIFMPFILLFMSVRFSLENAERFYSSRSSLGHRNWSWLAHWSFREYCELPHIFYARLNKSHKPAQKYIAQFRYTLGIILARSCCFVAGSFLAILIVFSILDEHVPLYVEYEDRNMLWYGAILTAIVTICRLLIPEEEHPTFAPDEPMKKIVEYTHYRLTQNCRKKSEFKRFSTLYPYKVTSLLQEMLSVVMAPVLLWSTYPRKIDEILTFVRNNSTCHERLGDVVQQSCFMDANHQTTQKMKNSLVSFETEHVSDKHVPDEQVIEEMVNTTVPIVSNDNHMP